MPTYKDAGVDIEEWNKTASVMKGIIRGSFNKDVLTELGSFGGAFSAKAFSKMKDPVLVSTIDGIGTKMKVAAMMNIWDTVGADLVNHSSNDILCLGAKPLFFLDYVAAEHLDKGIVLEIVKGISLACKELDCPLIGGETAEMPGVYEKGEYDLAGTMVGIVDKKEIIDGSKIKAGDVLIALPSTGLHTNGFSLARKILFNDCGYKADDSIPELNLTLGEALLKTHKSYSQAVLSLKSKAKIKGIAHITGGGITDNLPRIFPKGKGALIEKSKIKVLPIFRLLQEKGNVPEEEMFRAFNMGIGLIVAVGEQNASSVISELKKKGEDSYPIGTVVKGEGVRYIK